MNTTSFYKEMKVEVYSYFSLNHVDIKANYQIWIKFLIFLSSIITSYCLILHPATAGTPTVLLLLLLPFLIALLMINVLHDVMHGSLSHHHCFKDYLSYLLDLIGPSSFIWKTKHNISHHYFTNNSKLDNDLNVSSILRFSSHHKHLPIHRMQHFYITLAYCLQCFFWFFVSDFKNVIRQKVASKKILNFNIFEKTIFVINKCLHLFLSIVLPAHFVGLQNALMGYIVVYSLLGLMLALIFQVAHVFEGTKYHEIEKFENQDHWARLQLEGTCTFAVDSKIGHWLFGGLQFQAVHHLFPEISHVHFKQIYPIIQRHCQSEGIVLTTFPGLFSAIKSHYQQLYLLGNEHRGINYVHSA